MVVSHVFEYFVDQDAVKRLVNKGKRFRNGLNVLVAQRRCDPCLLEPRVTANDASTSVPKQLAAVLSWAATEVEPGAVDLHEARHLMNPMSRGVSGREAGTRVSWLYGPRRHRLLFL